MLQSGKPESGCVSQQPSARQAQERHVAGGVLSTTGAVADRAHSLHCQLPRLPLRQSAAAIPYGAGVRWRAV